MKRITAFITALFLVLGIVATDGFAQDNMMKQQDTMKRQTDTMMSSKKPVMKKRRAARKHRKTYRHRRVNKTMMKKTAVK
jgi:hypothetical protein